MISYIQYRICGDSAYIYVSSMTCNWNYNIHTLKYKINYMYIYIYDRYISISNLVYTTSVSPTLSLWSL